MLFSNNRIETEALLKHYISDQSVFGKRVRYTLEVRSKNRIISERELNDTRLHLTCDKSGKLDSQNGLESKEADKFWLLKYWAIITNMYDSERPCSLFH